MDGGEEEGVSDSDRTGGGNRGAVTGGVLRKSFKKLFLK